MLSYCCEKATGVDFECSKASAGEAFLHSEDKLLFLEGVYVGSCGWKDLLLWLVLHQSGKLELLQGAAILNTVLAGKRWC